MYTHTHTHICFFGLFKALTSLWLSFEYLFIYILFLKWDSKQCWLHFEMSPNQINSGPVSLNIFQTLPLLQPIFERTGQVNLSGLNSHSLGTTYGCDLSSLPFCCLFRRRLEVHSVSTSRWCFYCRALALPLPLSSILSLPRCPTPAEINCAGGFLGGLISENNSLLGPPR